jgi:hypothetical protein
MSLREETIKKHEKLPSVRIPIPFTDMDLYWTLDTWGTDENYDTLICNAIRALALFLLIYVCLYIDTLPTWFIFIGSFMSIMFAGITKVEYFTNGKEHFEFKGWG